MICYGEVIEFFTLRPSDLITTLTYVLMDNFCPCFNYQMIINRLIILSYNGFIYMI